MEISITERQVLEGVIVSKRRAIRFIVVLKKHYPHLHSYLHDGFKNVADVHLTQLAAGSHNSSGYNRIAVALKDSGLVGLPEDYQGYQVRYPTDLEDWVAPILNGFVVK